MALQGFSVFVQGWLAENSHGKSGTQRHVLKPDAQTDCGSSPGRGRPQNVCPLEYPQVRVPSSKLLPISMALPGIGSRGEKPQPVSDVDW